MTQIISANGKEVSKPKRVAVSKRVRFEVFKRDRFSCQYCGASAPDAVLHVDHIEPVSKGGSNDMMNLITSCDSCNLGKSDVLLSDDAAIQKQRVMLEELSERREQLEMMLSWRDGLKGLEGETYARFHDAWTTHFPDWSINEHGEKKVKALIKSVGILHALDALDVAVERYFDESKEAETVGEVFAKFQGIAKAMMLPEDGRQLLYIRGICRNRFAYVNEKACIALLREAYEAGVTIEALTEIAKTERNWTNWRNEMNALISEGER